MGTPSKMANLLFHNTTEYGPRQVVLVDPLFPDVLFGSCTHPNNSPPQQARVKRLRASRDHKRKLLMPQRENGSGLTAHEHAEHGRLVCFGYFGHSAGREDSSEIVPRTISSK
ncbi:hypothetical protein Vi05172_g3451 [Venturia inaequalis]|nr:hypothetical protein Vi05172_g3451 [Venturia inaequalis]